MVRSVSIELCGQRQPATLTPDQGLAGPQFKLRRGLAARPGDELSGWYVPDLRTHPLYANRILSAIEADSAATGSHKDSSAPPGTQ